jgi:hypothetical protein
VCFERVRVGYGASIRGKNLDWEVNGSWWWRAVAVEDLGGRAGGRVSGATSSISAGVVS